MSISANVRGVLSELPAGVELVLAIKGRTPEAVIEAIEAGVCIIGSNYVQEAEKLNKSIGSRIRWHFIGHIQKNKIKKAVSLFDMIETVDSFETASEIDRHCALASKILPVFIEINSGREPQKSGVLPDRAADVITEISRLKYIKVSGLMTMGPALDNPAGLRPYFHETKQLFDALKDSGILNVEMKYLSMGMSSSYRIAIDEGANIVRIGTRIFEG